MRQFDTLRKRYDPRSQWIQIGLASATLLTPLLKRWNDLRAAEQARSWRDEAEARLREVRSWNPLQRTTSRRQARQALEQVTSPRGNVSATIWLAGVSVGMVAAGAGAFILVRRRMRQEQDAPLLDLPVPFSGNGNGAGNGRGPSGNNGSSVSATAQAVARGISRRDNSATQAASNGVTPPALAPSQPATAPTGQAGPLMPPAATETTPATASSAPQSGVATNGTESAARAGIADANSAAFIGNIHTMVFHEADADDLPAEENRVYFASEDEARDAGFRRARDEVSSGGE